MTERIIMNERIFSLRATGRLSSPIFADFRVRSRKARMCFPRVFLAEAVALGRAERSRSVVSISSSRIYTKEYHNSHPQRPRAPWGAIKIRNGPRWGGGLSTIRG